MKKKEEKKEVETIEIHFPGETITAKSEEAGFLDKFLDPKANYLFLNSPGEFQAVIPKNKINFIRVLKVLMTKDEIKNEAKISKYRKGGTK